MNYDVVIIGGAIMGSSAAFWLSKMDANLKVLVIEADPGYARSSTALSVASIRQQFSTKVNVQISQFGIEFIRNIEQYLGQGAGISTLGFKENGYLFLAGSDAAATQMQVACDMQNQLGTQTALLTPDAIHQMFPWLNISDVTLGSFGNVNEGWFDNMGLLGGLKTASTMNNVRYIKGHVTGLTGANGVVNTVTLADGQKITAKTIVNAAGTQASYILQLLGEDAPVEARKRTVFLIDAPNAIHPNAPMLVCHSGFYLRPEHHQWLCAIVPNEDRCAEADDFEPDLNQFEEHIWEKLYARADGFDAVKVVSAWAGHYAYNRLDQNAIIGSHPVWTNLFLMNGFSGHGLQQAPAVGRGIAELILTGAYQTIDMSDLCVERIYNDAPFLEAAIV